MPFAGLMMYAHDPTKAENLNDPPGNFKAQPGALQLYNGNWYRYVIHTVGAAAVATTNGSPAFLQASATWTTTADKTSSLLGAAVGDGFLGVYLGVVTSGYGTWIQCSGEHPSVLVDGAGAVGQWLNIAAADQDTIHVAAVAAVATQIVGKQIATVSASRVGARLLPQLW